MKSKLPGNQNIKLRHSCFNLINLLTPLKADDWKFGNPFLAKLLIPGTIIILLSLLDDL